MDKHKELHEFFKRYKRFWLRELRKDGNDWLGKDEKLQDLLYDIKRSICDFDNVSESGCMRYTVNMNIKLEYGDFPFGGEKNVKESINLPIIIVDGSCGNKHIAIKTDKDEALDLGKAEFKNKVNNSGWTTEVDKIEDINKRKIRKQFVFDKLNAQVEK